MAEEIKIKNEINTGTAQNFAANIRSLVVSDITKRIALGIVAFVVGIVATLYADRQVVVSLDGRVSAIELTAEQMSVANNTIKDSIADINRKAIVRDGEIQNINNTITRVEEKIDSLLLKLAK